MIVQEVMVQDLITIEKEESLYRAQDLMVTHSVRHLPVVEGWELMGIITESDIRGAFILGSRDTSSHPDPRKMKVRDHMTRNPMTVSPDTNIEDAALLIYKNKIGALPVVRGDRIVGIISIMDFLGLFVDMMGLIHSSSRIDVVMGKNQKNLDAVSTIIRNHNIDIISVGMSPHPSRKDRQVYLFRLDLCDTAPLVKDIEAAGFKVESAIH